VRLPGWTCFGALGPRIPAALVGLGLLWAPAPALGAVTCSLAGTTLAVSLSTPEDAASVVRAGTEIEVRAGATEVNCGGTPTVDTVDTVTVTDPSLGTTTFTIDLSGGEFGPGATTGGEGASPEIEFQVDLGGQFPDRVVIVGTGGADNISFSGSGINLNAVEAPAVDADVTAAGVEEFEVRAGADADTVTGVPPIGSAFGGRMILHGEAGADVLTGGVGPDALFGGGGTDVLAGAAGTDRLSGEDDPDTIEGGAEADDLFGNAGSDDLVGQSGDDRLDGGSGADVEDGGEGADAFDQGPTANGGDTLAGGNGFDIGAYDLRTGNLTIEIGAPAGDGEPGEGDVVEGDVEAVLGGSGDDALTGADVVDNILRGGPGADVVDGSTGDDTIDGDAGDDALSGGGGEDLVSFFGAPAVTVNLATGTATGDGSDSLTGFENAEGGGHGDALIGSSGVNMLNGRAGGDALAGGDQDDDLQGGDGNDSLAGDSGNDRLRGNGGSDTVSYVSSAGPVIVDLRSGTGTGQGSDVLQGIENATGGASDDAIAGTDQRNVLTGGGGNDSMFGLHGDDDLRGSSGSDAVDGGGGGDTIAGGDGGDILSGATGSDVFLEGEQAGPNGPDIIGGGSGRDLVSYAGRRNGVRVSVGGRGADGQKREGDQVGADVEKVRGTRGRDVLAGNGKRNILIGADGNDLLQGRGGIDRLQGGAGHDRLDGGPSSDVCRGGGGRDVLRNCGKERRRPR
jgi:Ca2+-binding RTX toxin-like protein